MALKTYEVDGFGSVEALPYGIKDAELAKTSADQGQVDAGFVEELLLANTGLSDSSHGRMLVSLEWANDEIITASDIAEHRFLALELYLRATMCSVEDYWNNSDAIKKPLALKHNDALTVAKQFVNDLRSLERACSFATAVTVKLCKTLSKSLYAETYSKISSFSKVERAKFNDVLATSNNISVNWSLLQAAPNALAVLYNFSPYTDTGAVVASKRIRESGDLFDVISCSFANRKKIDNTIERIAAPYVASKHFLPLIPSWATWDAFKGFAIKASRLANDKVAQGHNYDYFYTRAMWAPSHYAGALIKRENPTLTWIAEFSDPLSLDVEGLARGGELPEDKFLLDLIADIEQKFGAVPPEYRTIFSIAEIIAYAFADQIVFTNQHQQTVMLDHIYSSGLRDRVAKIAKVSNHPTLPRAFYDAEAVDYNVDPSVINLAYFGEFYATRGLTEVTTAIRMLPQEVRNKVHLHVFTNYIPVGSSGARPRGMSAKAYDDLVDRAISGVGAYGIENQVHLNGSLPYLNFLGITKKFDYLLVNDAQSGEHHAVNPYLPSKWSDYAGSTASSWAFVEEGSSLADKPATVKTPLGDILAITNQLQEIISTKLGRKQ